MFFPHITFIVVLPRNVFLSMTWKFCIEVMLDRVLMKTNLTLVTLKSYGLKRN